MPLVNGYRNVTTRGAYMGEEGVGYGFGTLPEYGDFSAATQGHLQGYTQPVQLEITDEGQVEECMDGEFRLFHQDGKKWFVTEGRSSFPYPCLGLTASEAVQYGFAKVVELPIGASAGGR